MKSVALCRSKKQVRVTFAPLPTLFLLKRRLESPAVVAGGCFWGIQAVFQHVKGVISATSGYSGGAAATAEYELVSTVTPATRNR